MSKLIRAELSVDACVMLETSVSFMLARNEESHAFLLHDGMPETDEVMQDDAKMIGTLRNLLDVLRASVGVYVVMRKGE